MSAWAVNGMSGLRQRRYDAMLKPNFRRWDALLGAWSWVAFRQKGHSTFADWSLEASARFPRLQIDSGGPSKGSSVDRTVAPLGVTRGIRALVTHFSMAPPVLAHTDTIC